MPWEVLYSYPEIKDGTLVLQDTDVPTNTVDEAERVALDKLSDILPEEIAELDIESIRAI